MWSISARYRDLCWRRDGRRVAETGIVHYGAPSTSAYQTSYPQKQSDNTVHHYKEFHHRIGKGSCDDVEKIFRIAYKHWDLARAEGWRR